MRAFERRFVDDIFRQKLEGHNRYTAAAAIKKYRSHRRINANGDIKTS
jgi:hypothetical protein